MSLLVACGSMQILALFYSKEVAWHEVFVVMESGLEVLTKRNHVLKEVEPHAVAHLLK